MSECKICQWLDKKLDELTDLMQNPNWVLLNAEHKDGLVLEHNRWATALQDHERYYHPEDRGTE